MPHDRHNKQLEIGDTILVKPINYSAIPVAGRVVSIKEGQTCIGQIAFLTPFEGIKTDYFNAQDATILIRWNGEVVYG